MAGFLLFNVAQAGDALALRFAPQSVVQPAGSVSLLANLLFGYWLNNEPIGKLTPMALCVIISGVALIVTFGPKGTAEWGPRRIADRWLDPDVLVYAAVAGSTAVTLLALLAHYDRRISRHTRRLEHEAMARRAFAASLPRPYGGDGAATPTSAATSSTATSSTADATTTAAAAATSTAAAATTSTADATTSTAAAAATTAAGIAVAQEALREQAPHEQPHALSCLSPRERRLVSLLYPVTAAVVAGWTPLLVKQALLLLGAAFGGDHTVWSHGATYCILGGVLCSAPLQLTCLAKGLRYVEAQLVVPTFASCFTICSIIGGSVFFQEFDGFCPARIVLFAASALLTLLGVCLLYQRMPSEAAAAAAQANGAQAGGGDSFIRTTTRSSSERCSSAGVIVGWELAARARTPRTAAPSPRSAAPSVAPPRAQISPRAAAPSIAPEDEEEEGRRRRDLYELPSLPLLACALPLDAGEHSPESPKVHLPASTKVLGADAEGQRRERPSSDFNA